MLKNGTLINKKFCRMLIPSVLAWSSYCINLMIDAILGGNQLGEAALTAVSIVAPLFSVVYFFSLLVAPGFGVLYGKYNGEFNKEYSYKIAGQSIISAFGISIFAAALLMAVKEPYIAYYECTGEILSEASAYYNCVIAYCFVNAITRTLYYLVLVDGDTAILMLSSLSEIVLNIVLSTVLCKRLGTAGLGIATIISGFVGFLFGMLHIFSKSNSLKFKMHFKWKDFLEAMKYSISRFTGYIFIALVDIVINKVIIETCSITLVPAYSVINLAFAVFEIIGSVFDSSEGFLSTYLGEKNNYGIKNVMKTVLITCILLEFVLGALIFLSAPLLPKIYGMTSAEAVAGSVFAARVMAFGAIPFGIAYLAIEIFATLNKPGLSLFASFLSDFSAQLLIPIPLAYLFGFKGISLGMSLSPYFAIAVFTLVVIIKYGKKDFSLYLEDHGETVVSFDIAADSESVALLLKNVDDSMKNNGLQREEISILLEKLYGCIIEKNTNKKVLSECTLFFGNNSVRVIIRDNGKTFNFMEGEGVREELVGIGIGEICDIAGKFNYTLTTSFNRNGFVVNRF